MRDADTTALKDLIQTRIAKKKSTFVSAGNEFDPTLFGFEITNEELAAHDEMRQARQFAQGDHSRLSEKEYERYMANRKQKQEMLQAA